jgi:hypothetical protein
MHTIRWRWTSCHRAHNGAHGIDTVAGHAPSQALPGSSLLRHATGRSSALSLLAPPRRAHLWLWMRTTLSYAWVWMQTVYDSSIDFTMQILNVHKQPSRYATITEIRMRIAMSTSKRQTCKKKVKRAAHKQQSKDYFEELHRNSRQQLSALSSNAN